MRLCLISLFLSLCAGCGIPSFLVTPVENSPDLQEITAQGGQGFFPKKVAIIEVEGTLINAKSGGLLTPTENPLSLFTQELDKAADDSSVVAVVLRINSPGGAVATSDTMYDEVIKFRKKTSKPVIASAQEVDASGAYYVSCACDRIVVHPAGLIGSVGVIFETFDASGTMEKIGLRAETIKSAELKDIGSPFKPMTPHEHEVLQALIDTYFTRFKNIVTTNRPIKTDEQLAQVDDGRVFIGPDAVRLGLADQTGRLDDAIDLAKSMAHCPGAAVILYKRPYGYGGSIYADTSIPEPKSNVLTLSLPTSTEMLPGGFYYIWAP